MLGPVLRRIEGTIELPSGVLHVSAAVDLAAPSISLELRRADGTPVALGNLEPVEAVGVEIVVLRNLWMRVAVTDPVASAELAMIEALVREAKPLLAGLDRGQP
jgi:hypothetical protein